MAENTEDIVSFLPDPISQDNDKVILPSSSPTQMTLDQIKLNWKWKGTALNQTDLEIMGTWAPDTAKKSELSNSSSFLHVPLRFNIFQNMMPD